MTMPDTNPPPDDMDRHVCLECSYMYDPRKGDPTQGIPPGTPFRKLPSTWRCPECKISILKAGVFKRLIEKPPEELPAKEKPQKKAVKKLKK
jgi:rubredoxin